MWLKPSIFVLFAIVLQICVLQSSATSDVLLEQDYNDLDKLEFDERAVLFLTVKGLKAFFGLLKNATEQIISNKCLSQDLNLTAFTDAACPIAEANEVNFYALSRVVGNCSAFEPALKESIVNLNGTLKTLVDAVGLAQRGNYSCEISSSRLVSTVPTLLDLIQRCSSNTCSDDFEALIESVSKKLDENFAVMIGAFCTATKALSDAVASKENLDANEAAEALALIEASLAIAITTVADTQRRIFAVYETRVIDSRLNRTDIVEKIFTVRLLRKIASQKIEETVETIFVVIERNLEIGVDYYCSDAEKARAVASFQDAFFVFFQAARSTLVNSDDSILIAELLLPKMIPIIIDNYLYGIELVRNPVLSYSAKLLAIRSLEGLQILMIKYVAVQAFGAIGSDASIKARLDEQRNRVIGYLNGTNRQIFDGMTVALGENCRSGESDVGDIGLNLKLAILAIRNAVKDTFYALIIKLIHESGY